MLTYISGPIAQKALTYLVIDINGLGYEVKISLQTYHYIQPLREVKLFTHLQIKEDAHTLYGFYNVEEKAAFLALVSIKNVGPTIAMAILSALTTQELATAISQENINTLLSVKGVGKKVAQRIILELKDKLTSFYGDTPEVASTSNTSSYSEALRALVQLGLPKNNAEKTLQELKKQHGADVPAEKLIKLALQQG